MPRFPGTLVNNAGGEVLSGAVPVPPVQPPQASAALPSASPPRRPPRFGGTLIGTPIPSAPAFSPVGGAPGPVSPPAPVQGGAPPPRTLTPPPAVEPTPQPAPGAGGINQFLTPAPGRVDFTDVGRGLAKGVVGDFVGRTITGAAGIMDTVDRNIGGRAVRALDAVGLDNISNTLENVREATNIIPLIERGGQAIRDFGERIGPEDTNLATDVAGGLGQVAGQIVTLIATGGAGSVLQLMGQGASIQDDRVDELGTEPGAARDIAILGGAAVTALTERFGLGVLLNRIPGVKTLIGRMLAGAGAEASQEIIEQVGQNLLTRFTIDPNQSVVPEGGLAKEGMVGGIVGGIVSGVIPGRQGARPPRQEPFLPPPPPIQPDGTVPPQAPGSPTTADLAADLADPRPIEEINAEREQLAAAVEARAAEESFAASERVIARNQLPTVNQPITVTDGDGNVITGTLLGADELEFDGQVIDQVTIRDAETGEVLLYDTDEIQITQGDGTQANPVKVETATDVEVAAAVADPDPTEAQKEAENYKQGHVRLFGLDVTIENAKGSTRRKLDKDGNLLWEVVMPAHYGKVRGTVGADGDQVDVYIGDDPASQQIWGVDQINPEDGSFDEHKIMVGFPDVQTAMQAYISAFNDGSGPSRVGGITPMTVEGFKDWVEDGNTKVPLSTLVAAPPAPRRARKPKSPPVQEGAIAVDEIADTVGAIGSGIADTLRDHLFGRIEAGEVTETTGGEPSLLLQVAKAIKDRGGSVTRENMADIDQDVSSIRDNNTGPAFQSAIQRYLDDVAPEVVTPPLTPPPQDQPQQTLAPASQTTTRPRREAKPADILRFIASVGGIRDNEGHDLVRSRGARRFIPGIGPLIRPNGLSVDGAGELLFEAGFFAERPTEAEVLDVLDNALAGERVVSEQDRQVEDARVARDDAAVEQERDQEALGDVETVLAEFGEDIRPDERQALAEEVRATGRPVDEVVGDFVERLAFEFEEDYFAEQSGEISEPTPTGNPEQRPGQDPADTAEIEGPPTIAQNQGQGPARSAPVEEAGADERQKPTEVADPVEDLPPPTDDELDAAIRRIATLTQGAEPKIKAAIAKGVTNAQLITVAQAAGWTATGSSSLDNGSVEGRGKKVTVKIRGHSTGFKGRTLAERLRRIFAAPVTEEIDQGTQTLVPGVAPVTDQDRVQVQADAPLRSTRPQQAPNDGLFDVAERGQLDLVQQAQERARNRENVELPAANTQLPGQEATDVERERTGELGQGELAEAPQPAVQEAGGGQAGQDVLREAGPGGVRAPDPDRGPVDGGRDTAARVPREAGARDADRDAGERDSATGTDIAAGLRDSEGNKSGRVQGVNYNIQGLNLPRGAKTRARSNIAAIKLLKKIEGEGRLATKDEQAELVKYVGWGGIPQAFDARATNFKDIFDELKAALGPEEYAAARASTPNAHYTSETIVRAMWRLADRIGFTGGKVLEPSAGIGHFFGLLPNGLAGHTPLVGVELDSITGRIAKLLYPKADIKVDGFEKVSMPDNYFDMAIGNVPFGNFKLNDPRYNKLNLPIHNYFFAKSLDKVRPGGAVVFITSHFTMDATNPAFRTWLSERADLVGAIRLPNTAFKGTAGTDVTTDIIVLRKRADGDPAVNTDWVGTTTLEGNVGLNNYFAGNPRMVLGKLVTETKRFAGQELVVTGDLTVEKLNAAIDLLPAAALTPAVIDAPQDRALPEPSTAIEKLREGEHFLRGKRIFVKRSGVALSAEPKRKTDSTKTRGLIKVRDAVVRVLEAQLAGESAVAARRTLNKAYDAFEKVHGPVGKVNITKGGARLLPNIPTSFRSDPGYPILLALENFDNKGTASKTAIFSQDVISQRETVASVNVPSDAIPVVLNELGRIDIDRIAELSNVTKDEAIKQLAGLIYLNPNGNTYVAADDYLSGNVRVKLDEARAAKLTENIEALEEVQPKPLRPDEITANMGAPWVPASDVQDFLTNLLSVGQGRLKVTYTRKTARWTAKGKIQGVAATKTWGTDRMDAMEIAGRVLNGQTINIVDRHRDGTSTPNPKATADARSKAKEMAAEFQRWLWADSDRAARLGIKYNYEFNAIVPRKFDGSYLTMPGLAPLIRVRGQNVPFKLTPHQLNAVARVVQRGNTLMAHVVGAGKTFSMIAAGMEMKRLGLVNKPMYAVPNHMLEQFSREFLQAYPAARIIVADKQNFSAANRKAFVARIAAENLDAVIITHSAFERVPVSSKFQQEFVKKEIDEYVAFIDEAKREEGGKGASVKELEKAKKRAEARLEKLLATEKKDVGIEFEQTGIDFMFVDEAHLFKNLSFATRMQNVRGLSQGNSQRAMDLFLKTRYLEGLNPGRSAVFATGTPISNTMAEMFTMMRYLQLNDLEAQGLENFDAWAKAFGNVTDSVELKPSGTGFRVVTRFSEFVNVPDLINLWSNTADVQTAESLNLPRPDLEGGEIEVVDVPPSEEQTAFVLKLAARAETIKGKPPEPGADNMLKIVGEGRKAAMDMRLLGPSKEPGKKVAKVVDNVFKIWKSGKDPKLVQMVFADLGTPGRKRRPQESLQDAADNSLETPADTDGEASVSTAGVVKVEYDDEADAGSPDTGWNAYTEIRKQLVARGVPVEQIAFIHDANSDSKKAALFAALRAGDIRIVVGSTAKMGMGTNVQDKLYAMHHLDAPWRPADVEQRDGRILRQGNLNEEVRIFRYVTTGTFDAYSWQILTTKAKFISQIMAGAKGKRRVEDVDAVLPEAATIMAIATGDERFLQQAELNQQVQDLALLRGAHTDNQNALGRQARTLPGLVKSSRKVAEAMAADVGRVTNQSAENFRMELAGTLYGTRKDANDAIEAAIRAKLDGAPIGETFTAVTGKFSGFDLTITGVKQAANKDQIFIATRLEGAATHSGAGGGQLLEFAQIGKVDHATRLVNILGKMDDAAKRQAIKASETAKELKDTQEQIGKPFAKEAEFQTKTKKLDDLNKELSDETTASEEAGPKPGSADVDEALSTRPSLFNVEVRLDQQDGEATLASQITAFIAKIAPRANLQLVQDSQEVLYLPDGRTIKGQGRYTGTRDLIRVALGGSNPAFVASHEAIHHLVNVGVFTAEEWNVINDEATTTWMAEHQIRERYSDYYGSTLKKFPDLIESAMVEEAIADAYATWRVNKASQSLDPAIVKIFRKIQAFWNRLRNFLKGKGFTTVDDVFSKVDRGVVGRRRLAAEGVATRLPQGQRQTLNKGDTGFIDKLSIEEAPTPGAAVLLSIAPSTKRTGLFGNSFEHTSATLRETLANQNLLTLAGLSEVWKVGSDPLRIKLQDKFLDMKRVQESIGKARKISQLPANIDTYLHEELMHGRIGEEIDNFRTQKVEPLIKAITDAGVSLEQFELYLYARHAPERNEQIAKINEEFLDGGSGMTDAEAADIMNDFKPMAAQLESLARRVDEINAAGMRVRLQGDLIDKSTAGAWMKAYKKYVPLRGFDDATGIEGSAVERPKIGKGIDIRGPESGRAYGRTSRATDILSNVLSQYEEAVVRAGKNQVGKTFLAMVEANPNPDMWEVSKKARRRVIDPTTGLVTTQIDPLANSQDNVLAVKAHNGTITYITIHHPGLARAMKNIGVESANTLIRGMMALNRYLAFMSTSLNPTFVLSNFLRDIQTAGINITEFEVEGIRTAIAKDIPKAMAGAYGGLRGRNSTEWENRYHDFSAAGGKIAFFGLVDIETKRKQLLRQLRDLQPGNVQKAKRYSRAVFKYIQDVNGAVENAVRLAAYKNLLDAGITKPRAASAARNLTVNFNRKGELGPQVNALWLFYNASLQGTVRMLTGLQHKRTRKIVGGIMLTSFSLTIINALMAPDDEDGINKSAKIPKWTRENNIIVMNPFAGIAEGDEGDMVAMKIPMPYGYNWFWNMGTNIADVVLGQKKPMEAAVDQMVLALNTYNPIGSSSDILSTMTPTALKPAIEIGITNKNFAGSPIKPEVNPFDPVPKPDSQRYWNSVSTTSRVITDQLNSLTRGNTVRPGGIDVSPETLDYLIGFAFGGAGMFVNRSGDFMLKHVTGDEIEWRDVPFARRVVEGNNRFYSASKYRDIKGQALLLEREYKSLIEDGRPAAAAKTLERHRVEKGMIGNPNVPGTVKWAEKLLRGLSATRRNIEGSTTLSSKDKKALLKKNADSRQKVHNAVLKRFTTITKTEKK